MSFIYTAFKIFNLDEFNALDLVSKEYPVNLEGIGFRSILVTKGNYVSMLFDGNLLSLGLTTNPFVFNGYAIFQDPNNDVWLGKVN